MAGTNTVLTQDPRNLWLMVWQKDLPKSMCKQPWGMILF